MKKVLIIDDEEDICLLLKSQLTRKAYEVQYALSLQDGLKQMEDFAPAILILDNNLPDGMGIETLPVLKKKYPDTRLLVISAYTSLIDQAIRNGADAFISKPFNFATIIGQLA